MYKKSPVEYTSFGFVTENHANGELLGRTEWFLDTDYGIHKNEDGSASIDADTFEYVVYMLGRGTNECLQNTGAFPKGTPVEPKRVKFEERRRNMKARIIGAKGTRKAREEKEFDADDMTLQLVMGKSLIQKWGFNPKETAKLVKFISVAASEVARRHEVDAEDVMEEWKEEVERFNASLPM